MDRDDFAERLAALRESRARLPELVRNRHASRKRRPVAAYGGRLILIEADAPGRAQLSAGGDDSALADRGRLLNLLCDALGIHGVAGLIASADIIDDVLLLEQLEERLAIGSMNLGGLAGSEFELDDRFTGYDPESVVAGHLDGGKVRLRIDPNDPAMPRILESAAHALNSLASGGVMVLVEPTWTRRGTAGFVEDRSAEALVRAMDVTTALGSRSPYTWLALPDSEELAEALLGTTLPVLVRLDPDPVDPADVADRWRELLCLPGVRGFVMPATLLYPRSGDPLAAVSLAATLVGELS